MLPREKIRQMITTSPLWNPHQLKTHRTLKMHSGLITHSVDFKKSKMDRHRESIGDRPTRTGKSVVLHKCKGFGLRWVEYLSIKLIKKWPERIEFLNYPFLWLFFRFFVSRWMIITCDIFGNVAFSFCLQIPQSSLPHQRQQIRSASLRLRTQFWSVANLHSWGWLGALRFAEVSWIENVFGEKFTAFCFQGCPLIWDSFDKT